MERGYAVCDSHSRSFPRASAAGAEKCRQQSCLQRSEAPRWRWRTFYHTDRSAITFTSDEYNGQTRDRSGTLRPLIPRQFKTLSETEEENGQSRIYLGIHFSFDKTEGITMGQRIANYVMANAFLPVRGRR